MTEEDSLKIEKMISDLVSAAFSVAFAQMDGDRNVSEDKYLKEDLQVTREMLLNEIKKLH